MIYSIAFNENNKKAKSDYVKSIKTDDTLVFNYDIDSIHISNIETMYDNISFKQYYRIDNIIIDDSFTLLNKFNDICNFVDRVKYYICDFHLLTYSFKDLKYVKRSNRVKNIKGITYIER